MVRPTIIVNLFDTVCLKTRMKTYRLQCLYKIIYFILIIICFIWKCPSARWKKNLSFVGDSNSYVGDNKSYVGVSNSYLGDNKSYVGVTNTYVGDNKYYVGISKSYVGVTNSYVVDKKSYVGDSNSYVVDNVLRRS